MVIRSTEEEKLQILSSQIQTTVILSKMTSSNLDQFYPSVLSKDPTARLECFSLIETYLNDEQNSVITDDLLGFFNGLIKWIEGNNHRVC